MDQYKIEKKILKALYGKFRGRAILQFCLATETDKGCVVTVEPALSGVLTDLIKTKFGDVKAATFARKIKVAYEKGLIPENIYHDLELIRKIRNQIAHEEGMVGFDDKEIIELCAKFKNAHSVANDDQRKVFCSVANNILALLSFAQSPAHKLDPRTAIEMAQEGIKLLAEAQN